MIYLIGGVPRSGKSTLARLILKEKKISYFSIDLFMMAFHKNNNSLGINVNLNSDERAELIWPYLKNMIITQIDAKEDFIFEGDIILPKYIKSYLKQNKNIKMCFLGYESLNIEKSILLFKKNRTSYPNDWFSKKSKKFMVNFLEKEVKKSKLIHKQCLDNKYPYFDISNSYESGILKAFNHLFKK